MTRDVTQRATLEDVATTDRWLADVVVLPKEGVNDPEGEAILAGLRGLEYGGAESVRAGRFFRIELNAATRAEAETEVEGMCDRLLANPVIEQYRVTIAPQPDRSRPPSFRGGAVE